MDHSAPSRLPHVNIGGLSEAERAFTTEARMTNLMNQIPEFQRFDGDVVRHYVSRGLSGSQISVLLGQ